MTLPSVLDPFFVIACPDPGRPAVTDNGTTVRHGRPAGRAGAVADLSATPARGPHPPVAVTPHHSVSDIGATLDTPDGTAPEDGGITAEPAARRAHPRATLPPYLVPDRIVAVPEPHPRTGKAGCAATRDRYL
ncbi:hypothetical protein AMK26_09000 [Streptomyces sp. CB03234]|uniref:hypothetical protein n=1 Tax=Streptomyces sp. (strain CB03234) TaxID=1703937 RepID=UPI00093B8C8D|nr:hypothetical protein [Streptomyces sp. CB03234]OKK06189.1 hypothetical protein AMK26_09000 [Streptomyces sp. CB03234]